MSQRYSAILNPFFKHLGGCPLVKEAIATVSLQFPGMDRHLLARNIYLHCFYSMRIVFYCAEADGPTMTFYTLASQNQVEAFIVVALRDGFDAAMDRMDTITPL